MPPILALVLCSGLIVAMLAIERRNNPQASAALWIPTLWIMISASRPVGYWFESGLATTLEEGSSYDRLALSALIILALFVLLKRNMDLRQALRDNFGLVLLYLFLGMSIIWSDYAYLSLRRWIRLLGALPVALVVLSEESPRDALESVIRRCAYVLVPLSLVLIKYYPAFGVSFGRWSGATMWTGVTMTKNSLGQLCAITAFFVLWSWFRDRKENREAVPLRRPADFLVLGLSTFMLAGIGDSFSATSVTVLVIGVIILKIMFGTEEGRRPVIAGYLLIGIIASWVLLMFSDYLAPLMSFLNRDATLTGRVDIWKIGLRVAAENPFLGTGFGGFWVTGNPISTAFGFLTAHNGLLDAMIETGAVGVCLLLFFQFALYKRFSRGLSRDIAWPVFGIAFLVMSFLYNYTESIFLKSSQYAWNLTVFLALIIRNEEDETEKDAQQVPFEPPPRDMHLGAGN